MKKLLLLAIIAVSTTFFANAQKAKTAKPTNAMTVKEYFMAIPTEFIKSPAAKRAAWIENEVANIGYLSYNIPIEEITGEKGEGKVWGELQVFEKKDGSVLIGMITNLCADGECTGMLKFLDYKAGEFTDASEDYLITPDNDEVVTILRNAPAYEKKASLKDGEQVQLALQFSGNDKTISFVAGCEKSCDGGVVAKQYKWNGVAFIEYETPESPM